MRIFLSYASEDRPTADAIRLALEDDGHDVFYDREDLPPGDEFHNRIRTAIERSELVVFLVSPKTLDAGSYTLNEIAIAEKTFPAPAGHLLPVLLEKVNVQELPAYLRSVTFLETPGNVTAAVSDAVCRIARERRRKRIRWIVPVAAAVVLCAVAAVFQANRGTPAERVGKDGAPAMLVPAGKFTMGDDESWPSHPLYLDAFYMDRFEITTARFAKFLAATGSINAPDVWDEVKGKDSENMPVIGVSWNDANAYCRWAGRRLPTDAEWEKAARGTDGRAYPWGNSPPTLDLANYENSAPGPYENALSPVGEHAAGKSPYGIEDMAGNASEWVADWYSESFSADETANPKGPAAGDKKVIRGGGRYDPAQRLSAARRMYASPDTRADDIGFRCARDL
ncbi:MAG TPA: SUMF1/EgtB/PvdO family nonheme iron enzyme [Povalibacter sp.]|nr:SUMF1/EgtB/PvdO family nonheme iron enzyme [Povalibacter sp.]